MTNEELIGGVKKILESAVKKFTTLCEENGIDPEDPILTGEEDEEGAEAEGETSEEGEKTEAPVEGDANAMPVPPAEGAEAANVPPEVPPATEIPPEATTVDAPVPPAAEGNPEAAPQLTPEEEEALKAELEKKTDKEAK